MICKYLLDNHVKRSTLDNARVQFYPRANIHNRYLKIEKYDDQFGQEFFERLWIQYPEQMKHVLQIWSTYKLLRKTQHIREYL